METQIKKAKAATLILDGVDLRENKKGSFHEVDITILSVYAPNNRSANHVMGKKKTNAASTITAGEFNNPLNN